MERPSCDLQKVIWSVNDLRSRTELDWRPPLWSSNRALLVALLWDKNQFPDERVPATFADVHKIFGKVGLSEALLQGASVEIQK
jgi:hypothetical protein